MVDHERVLLRLKEKLRGKRSWGRDQVYSLIAELEVECQEKGPLAPQSKPASDGPLRDEAASAPSSDMADDHDHPEPEEASHGGRSSSTHGSNGRAPAHA